MTRRQERSTPRGGPGQIPCPRCRRDVARLPVGAKFCPRCGGAVPLVRPTPAWREAVTRAGRPLVSLHRRLTRWSHAEFDDPDRAQLPGNFTEAVRTAYATAMTRLGARYETSLSSYNLREALRCYRKAARLGNATAEERLIARGAGLLVEDDEHVPYARNSSAG